jgi:hypothetical protein
MSLLSSLLLELDDMLDHARQRAGMVSQAVLDSELRSKDWKTIRPLSVGDDYSIVVKIKIREPDDVAFCRLCEENGLRLGSIKNFNCVVIKDHEYFGVGKGAVRVTTNFPSALIEKILRLLV